VPVVISASAAHASPPQVEPAGVKKVKDKAAGGWAANVQMLIPASSPNNLVFDSFGAASVLVQASCYARIY
jgi:hypothetical protein